MINDDDGKLREPVLWFAKQMENILRTHDDRGGWSECGDLWLFNRMREESQELKRVLGNPEKTIHEAVDVANFCMMIADNERRYLHGGIQGGRG